ncbi:MAG: putative archaeal preflagellin peptidase FlaK [Candidatus Bathyarchaeota archaeon B26-2]|nr:MAG: putative archaeal preflagellin peptidase FlaK [Candidatus Bathyarchaeota archaeon B26-2]
MHEWLEAARVGLSLFFLSLSSWYDLKEREVSNKVWLVFAPLGFALSVLQFHLTRDQSFIVSMGLSTLIIGGFSVALFYLGLFGGADAKALICLSLTLPVQPSSFRPLLNVTSPFFTFSVLINAVLFSSVSIFGMALYNLYRRFGAGEELFEGLESEPLLNKILAFFTGLRVDVNKLNNSPYYIPLETVSMREDGTQTRRLKIFFRLSEDSEIENLDDVRGLEGKIWVTPSLPFIVFITAGFVAALFLGDVLMWLVALLVNFI